MVCEVFTIEVDWHTCRCIYTIYAYSIYSIWYKYNFQFNSRKQNSRIRLQPFLLPFELADLQRRLRFSHIDGFVTVLEFGAREVSSKVMMLMQSHIFWMYGFVVMIMVIVKLASICRRENEDEGGILWGGFKAQLMPLTCSSCDSNGSSFLSFFLSFCKLTLDSLCIEYQNSPPAVSRSMHVLWLRSRSLLSSLSPC